MRLGGIKGISSRKVEMEKEKMKMVGKTIPLFIPLNLEKKQGENTSFSSGYFVLPINNMCSERENKKGGKRKIREIRL